MKIHRLLLLTFFIAYLALFMGCKDNTDTTTTILTPTPMQTIQPKGTITGKIKDACTNAALSGAVISVGYDGAVQTVTSDASGSFSFANVPVGKYQTIDGKTVATGNYTLTASMVNYNSGITDPAKRYRPYYYMNGTITFTSLVQGDSLAVADMVGSVIFNISVLNTTITGTIVDVNQQPVANAIVILKDATIIPNAVMAQAVTSASGSYRFTNVDNGLTVALMAVSADGSMEGSLAANLSLLCNITGDSIRSQVTAERIMISPVDDVAPFVISLTPENNADVSLANLQVVYMFSEPIKQNAYTRTDLPIGHGTFMDDITFTFDGFKKVTGDIPFTAAWNASSTQLTLTPQNVVGSGKYTVDMSAAFNTGNITDAAGKAIVNNTKITGDFEALKFTTAGASTAPAAPVLARRYITGVYIPLDFSGGTVGLEWNYDANARSYNVYRSVGNDPFQLLAGDVKELVYAPASGVLVYPAVNNPLRAISARFMIRGVSKDLVEGPVSDTITVVDAVKPRLLNAVVISVAPPANTWRYTIQFSEPLTMSAAENLGNYSFTNTGAVNFTATKVDYLGYSAVPAPGYYVRLTVSTDAAPIPGYSLIVGTGMVDLANNPIDATANSHAF